MSAAAALVPRRRCCSILTIYDDLKLVSGLGGSGLAMPVEVVQFCWNYNLIRLQELFEELFEEEGYEAKLRLGGDGKPYITHFSNYIVFFRTPIEDSGAAGKEIKATPSPSPPTPSPSAASNTLNSGAETQPTPLDAFLGGVSSCPSSPILFA